MYYRRNLIKEVKTPTSQQTPVQDSEAPQDQGVENPTESCTDNKMSENDKSDVVVLENVEEKDSGNKTEVKAETRNNEAEYGGHIGKVDEYDLSLDILIALRKGTRSCIKHPVNYVSYNNLSPQLKAFTASLNSTIISKTIHNALECPEWKNIVMKEIKALEKNKT
ncbi:hypothetical protein IC582_007838 [Cucumis melo]